MSNDIALPPQAGRIGQATAVEQSRAVAQVEAAVLVAKQYPRDVRAAVAEMEQACKLEALAHQAFYNFRRGGSTVAGSTVYLARELARIWGNIDVNVSELRRDDHHGQSEMLAVAWDLQANNRVSTVFIVPHKRDKDSTVVDLVSLRDVYENNANAGARRVRECIYSVLPRWFVVAAERLCHETLETGGDTPLPQRIAAVVRTFDDDFRISIDRLERKLDRPAAKWTGADVAQLITLGTSLRQGTITADEALPPIKVSAAEIQQQAATPKAAAVKPAPAQTPPVEEPVDEWVPPAEEDTPAEPTEDPKISETQLRKLMQLTKKLGLVGEAARTDVVSTIIGRIVEATKDVTADEAPRLLSLLEQCTVDSNPAKALDGLLLGLAEDGGA